MNQALTTQDRSLAALPAVDLREPASLLLLPTWLAEQVKWVSDLGAGRTTIDPVTRTITGRVATIPASMMPTGPQRRAIMQRIEDLHAATRPGPLPKTLVYLGHLVDEHRSAQAGSDTVAVKIEAYEDAVGDLPAWAIREAIRRWRRGECSADSRDLDFAPKPARLRRMVQSIAATATGQAMRLQRVLDAEPEEPLTEAQMEANAVRMAAVLAELREPGAKETAAGTDAGVRAAAQRDLASLEAKAKAAASEEVS